MPITRAASAWIAVHSQSRVRVPLGEPVATYATAQESRPPERQKAVAAMRAMMSSRTSAGVGVDTIRRCLGFTEAEVPDDATDDQINAALDRRIAERKANMTLTQADGDAAISKAIAAGKIPEDARPRYQMEFSRNPEGTIALLERLEAAPVTVYASTPESPTDDREPYPAGWLRDDERSSIVAAESGAPGSRVVVEQ